MSGIITERQLPKRKYNIAARLELMNRKDHEIAIRHLLTALQPASRSSLYRWMNTLETDVFEIKYSCQQKIAAVFGCKVDDLVD
ncbi:hypothetical protein [Taibaiella koreensis]|uniref:hypothetical protein n=1 Tax=Taibaiella koreensis TaxID=1268548 RepID=UPI0013C2FA46|nr:hypothetical protein [Taibaiella koreensis]